MTEAPKLTRDQAKMVEDNIGLVGWAVSRYARHVPHSGTYSQEDAYQDAVFGLMRAVQKFDPDKGYRFATYARFWLQQSISRGQGTFEGLHARRIAAGIASPEDYATCQPLVARNDDGESWDVEFPSDVDVEEAVMAVARWDMVLAARDAVCRSDRDLELFDAMFDVHSSPTQAVKDLAVRWDVGVEAVRRRWRGMRQEVADRLGAPGESRP